MNKIERLADTILTLVERGFDRDDFDWALSRTAFESEFYVDRDEIHRQGYATRTERLKSEILAMVYDGPKIDRAALIALITRRIDELNEHESKVVNALPDSIAYVAFH